jgi:signal transduction histidine kinase
MTDFLLIVPVFLGALVGSTLGLYCFQRREIPGAIYLALLLLSAGWWSFFYGLELLTANPHLNTIWFSAGIIGNAFLAVFMLLYALDFAGYKLARSHWFIVLLSIEPVLHILITYTNSVHGLMYQSVAYKTHGGLTLAIRDWGIWFVVDEILGLFLVTLGMVLLLRKLLLSPGVFRRQLAGVMAGILVGVSTRVLGDLGFLPLEGYDLTHLAFVIGGSAMALSIFRFGMFGILPAAREKIVEELVDGIIVLDRNNYCVDANGAARRFLQGPRREVIGRPGIQALLPEVFAGQELSRSDKRPVELSIGDLQTYLLTSTPITADTKIESGSIVLVRDITNEAQLRQAHLEAVRLAVEAGRARSDFLANVSHELRTPLNLVLGFTDALKHDETAPLAQRQQEYVEEIERAGNQLLDLVNLVVRLTALDAGGREITLIDFDLVEFCRELGGSLNHQPGQTVQLTLPDREVQVCSDMEVTGEVITAIIKAVADSGGNEEQLELRVAGAEGEPGGSDSRPPRVEVLSPLFFRHSEQFTRLLAASDTGHGLTSQVELRTWLQIRLASRLAAHIGALLELTTDEQEQGCIAVVFAESESEPAQNVSPQR